jgi:hemerythrin-like domain-containing protein
MNDPLAIWHEEHANFAKLLNLLEGQLNLFHRSQTPNYALMLDIMCYMTHYPDLLHHPREDRAFEMVKQRIPSLGWLVDEMTAEHTVAVRNGTQLVSDLDSVVNGAILPRESVETPGREYIAHFRHHMVREEADLFPIVGKTLTALDWEAIDAAVKPAADPLFGSNASRQYEVLRREIVREASAITEI